MIPTKDRIKCFIHIPDPSCLLCNAEVESVEHLIFQCPVAAIFLIKSTWRVRIANYAPLGLLKWIHILLDDGNLFPIAVEEKYRMM